MKRKFFTKAVSVALSAALLLAAAPLSAPACFAAAGQDVYKARFTELYNKMHDSKSGYFSPLGIPYHSVETLMCEAPDYGHETTSETFSYYLWLEAMQDSFSGNWSSFRTAWDKLEKYMIPSTADQPEGSMSSYNPGKPATYAAEHGQPNDYPSRLDFGAAVGSDPISRDLSSTYGTGTMYGMHWLLDTDNWYGFGSHGDNVTSPSYINTFQRGRQESVWETIPQPCWETFRNGGRNGYLDLFTGDNSYSKQFKYTDAPDADARAVQATYDAMLWSGDKGASIASDISKSSKMGDYLRYAMFDKYFRKIGASNQAGNGYDAAHYLMSWYYAWGGSTENSWSWKIGCSHSHFGYQNPMTAWILSQNAAFKPKSQNGARDWNTSLKRQLEMYQWLQSSEGAIAGGCSNSNDGQYNAWPAGTSTFYGMGYQEHPVYADPGSNQWFGWQTWSMQRVAEYYYTTKDPAAKALLDKWVKWVKTQVKLTDDGGFLLPSTLEWNGAPDTWTGKATDNSSLHVSVKEYATDLGVAGSLANTLLYYSAASNDRDAQGIAKELLDRTYTKYSDALGVSAPETRADYSRFNDKVYVPSGWNGTMPNGDKINSDSTFLSLRSKYTKDPDWPKVEKALKTGTAPTFKYHRFWAETEFAVANGLYSKLYGTSEKPVPVVKDSTISPSTASFDLNLANQADVTAAVTLNGNTLQSISNGSAALTEGRDYTIGTDGSVTILKSYLAKQTVGSTVLTFHFSAGADAALTVTVNDTTKPVDPDKPVDPGKPVDPTPVTGNLKVQMFNANTSDSSNTMSPHFRVVNTGSSPLDLSQVKVRYYYTAEAEKPQTFWCDWASIGSQNVTGSFHPLSTATASADSYLELSFSASAGTLAPGASAEVQTRSARNDWSSFSQANDYSFDAADSSFADWSKATGYVGGKLQWGAEPSGTATPDQPAAKDSAVSPAGASFDKAAPADLSAALTLNGNTFTGIFNCGTKLTAGKDYTVQANTVVLSKDYLKTLPIGDTLLSFRFSAGRAATLSVHVQDSSAAAPTGSVSVAMTSGNTSALTSGISPRLHITNTGSAPLTLAAVTLRYYYTENGLTPQNFWCDWSQVGSSNVTGTFGRLDSADADSYLQIGFTNGAGTLAPGASIDVMARFAKSNWTDYVQTDDFSFNKPQNVAVFQNGCLLAGNVPTIAANSHALTFLA